MRKAFLTLVVAFTSLVATAIPAKHGVWQTLTLADGTEIRAQLTGDEHLHFWQTVDGQRFVVGDDGTARTADMQQLRSRAMARRSKASNAGRLRAPRRVAIGDRTHYVGKKRGIVILMEFTGTKFKAANGREKYNDILNKPGYKTSPFKGSVADYFKAQSGGQFELEFDVFGPYTAKYSASYYGSNDSEGTDKRPDALVAEAVQAADGEADFNDYDWDGDGEADQVFVVYAGKGEADGGGDNTIWPHMYWLSQTGMEQTLDGVRIDTYACANEVTPSGSLSGIGCFCHEFSHCLGYPDFYDILYKGCFGMSQFDLMDQGSYNGNAFVPAGYTAYEKWMAGWIDPIVLGKENVTVENLAPTSSGGDAYIWYNDAHNDEFYMIENRQKRGWDSSLPAKGLMITHVDFDKEIWEQNTPNSIVTRADVMMSQGEFMATNDHQRCTIFHADNDDDSKYWVSYGGYYTKHTLSTDLYPYAANNSLTATSSPSATLYNANSLGTKVMQGSLTAIAQNSDSTMNFVYSANPGGIIDTPDPLAPVQARGDTLFYESFDKCSSIGGNDGNWGTTIAGSSSKFATDNDGWTYTAAYAGYQCARFGNASKTGMAITPPFTIDGEATLTFRTAGWNADSMTLALSVEAHDSVGATVSPTRVTMASFAWTGHTVSLKGKGVMQLVFSAAQRFILDEVLVMAPRGVLPADVNGDGVVDVADIATVITVMASSPATTAGEGLAADVNGDGIVDVADIASIITIMANGQ